MASDGFLARIRQRYRMIKTPEQVEKASLGERRRRFAWMLLSTAIAGGVVLAPLLLLQMLLGITAGTTVTTALYGTALILILDAHAVFPWGFEHFDLVAPWQFRDVDEKERKRQKQAVERAQELAHAKNARRQSGNVDTESDLADLARELEGVEEEIDRYMGTEDLRDRVASVRMRLVERGLEEVLEDAE